MQVYRLRNKQTGKFFASWTAPWNPRHAGKAYWNDKGTFFRSIDTVIKHLKWTCSDWTPDPDIRWKQNPIISKYYPERLENFEIVVNDISINGEKIIQAADIIKDAPNE